MIVDSHCHLDCAKIYVQLDDIINRAFKNNVKVLLTICTTLESFQKIKLIIDKYNNIYGTFGIHPHEAKNYRKIDSYSIIKHKKENDKIIGIGETGLDYYYNHSDKNIQKDIFIEHIDAAKKLNIPLIVHSRNAETDTFDILKSHMNDQKLKVISSIFNNDFFIHIFYY